MCLFPDVKVYILFQNQGVRTNKSLGKGVYCYDPAKTVYGQTLEPNWYCPVKGTVPSLVWAWC